MSRYPDKRVPAEGRFAIRSCEVLVTGEPIEQLLLERRFDAVVSSDDSDLSMGGGVSSALSKLAGPQLQLEARALAPAPAGSILVTGPGRLPVRYVLHAITVDWGKGVFPSVRLLSQLSRELFVRCEALEIRSLVLPAIAAGVARFPAERLAEILLAELEVHCRNSSVLRKVVFTLPDPEARAAILGQLLSGPGAIPQFGGSPVRLDVETFAGIPEAFDPEHLKTPGDEAPTAVGRVGRVDPQALPPLGSRRPEARGSRAWRPGWWPFGKRLRPEDSDTQPMPAGPDRDPVVKSATARPVLEQRYVLLEELGRGGFSVVHMAWDLVLRRIVAIKRMRSEVTDRELLRHEAAVAIGLAHEGIVRIFHFEPGREESGPYLVMEYLSWPTGEKWLASAGEAGLPPRAVLEIGLRACDALAYAHDLGVLHLDIKPGNLFVDPGAERIKLADFGLSRSLDRERHALMTRAAGTPAYMAPEQSQPGNRVSAATDVFLLAATLWDMLTGAPPYTVAGDPERAARPGLPTKVLESLCPALANSPGDRPQNARAFIGCVESALTAC